MRVRRDFLSKQPSVIEIARDNVVSSDNYPVKSQPLFLDLIYLTGKRHQYHHDHALHYNNAEIIPIYFANH